MYEHDRWREALGLGSCTCCSFEPCELGSRTYCEWAEARDCVIAHTRTDREPSQGAISTHVTERWARVAGGECERQRLDRGSRACLCNDTKHEQTRIWACGTFGIKAHRVYNVHVRHAHTFTSYLAGAPIVGVGRTNSPAALSFGQTAPDPRSA